MRFTSLTMLVGIDALKYLYGPNVNSSMEHGIRLFEFLQSDAPEMWERHMGHDHFLVMARPTWDFSQPLKNDLPIWGTSFLELPEFYNVTALAPEARPWPWQEHAVPYPTSFHPTNLAFFEASIQRVRKSKRSILMLFAGSGGVGATPNVRRSIRIECENNGSSIHTLENVGEYSKICEMVDCSNGICEHELLRYMRPMLQATFCLQPPGDTPTRRSTFDSIIAGCIPVFFEELSAKTQYGWHIPEEQYGEFSVFVAKEEVSKGLRILDVLTGMPRREAMKKRERVVELIPRVMDRRHGSSMGLRGIKDAFNIAVEGTLQKIKARIHNFSAQ